MARSRPEPAVRRHGRRRPRLDDGRRPAGHGPTRGGRPGSRVDDDGDRVRHLGGHRGNDVRSATAKAGGTFSSVPDAVVRAGGWTPSLAVAPTAPSSPSRWFDSVNLDLDVALPAGPLQLAGSPPSLRQPRPRRPPPRARPAGRPLTVAGAEHRRSTRTASPRRPTRPSPLAFDEPGQRGSAQRGDLHERGRDDAPGRGAPGRRHLVGPGSVTYQVDALPAGIYYFRCDIHPTR